MDSRTPQSDLFISQPAANDEALAEDLRTRGCDLASDDLDIDLSDTPAAPGEDKARNLKFTDGSIPLDNAKHEEFLRLIAAGASKPVAYWEAINPSCTKKSATEQASRWLRRPAFQRRLRFLILDVGTKPGAGLGPVPAAGQAQPGARGGVQGGTGENGSYTKADVVRELERTAATTQNENIRLAALEKLAKLKGFVKDPNARSAAVEPAALMAFMAKADKANMDAVELARRIQEDEESGAQAQESSGPTDEASDDSDDDYDCSADGGAQDVGGVA